MIIDNRLKKMIIDYRFFFFLRKGYIWYLDSHRRDGPENWEKNGNFDQVTTTFLACNVQNDKNDYIIFFKKH